MDNFILFMADITLKQFRTILHSVTRLHIIYLKEIVNNILKSVIKLSREDTLFLRRGRHFLRKNTRRGALLCSLVKHYKILYRVIQIAKSKLTSLLKRLY